MTACLLDRLPSIRINHYTHIIIHIYIYNVYVLIYGYVCLYIIIQDNAKRCKRHDWTKPKQTDFKTRIKTLFIRLVRVQCTFKYLNKIQYNIYNVIFSFTQFWPSCTEFLTTIFLVDFIRDESDTIIDGNN